MDNEPGALRKWTTNTVICAAHSFFWGCLAGGNIPAMLVGVMTVILVLTEIDTHSKYQHKRQVDSTFAYAMDLGVKMRLYFAASLFIAPLFLVTGLARSFGPAAFVFMLPNMAEIWVGTAASKLCFALIGVSLDPVHHERINSAHHLYNPFLATYMTTLITAGMHIGILALFCGFIYACSRAMGRRLHR